MSVPKSLVLLAFLLSSGGASAQTPAQPAPCPVLQARYVLKDDPGFTAAFARMPGGREDLLYVKSSKTGLTYWFMMEIGNGYTDTYLYPIEDPGRTGSPARQIKQAADVPSMSLYEMNDAMQVLSQPASALASAPRYLFIPQLGMNLWYMGHLLAQAPEGTRERMPRALFVLSACDGLR